MKEKPKLHIYEKILLKWYKTVYLVLLLRADTSHRKNTQYKKEIHKDETFTMKRIKYREQKG